MSLIPVLRDRCRVEELLSFSPVPRRRWLSGVKGHNPPTGKESHTQYQARTLPHTRSSGARPQHARIRVE